MISDEDVAEIKNHYETDPFYQCSRSEQRAIIARMEAAENKGLRLSWKCRYCTARSTVTFETEAEQMEDFEKHIAGCGKGPEVRIRQLESDLREARKLIADLKQK